MATLSEKLRQFENRIKSLESKIINLSSNTEDKRQKPESKVGQIDLAKQSPLPSSGTGLGKLPGRPGNVIWNDGDASVTPWGQQPPAPTKGINKHSHSEFAGGALDIHTLELVEYETQDTEVEDPVIVDQYGSPLNKHCQAFWKIPPKIKQTESGISKIGYLDITFDETNKKWLAGGIIDVEKTLLLKKEEDGTISRDGKDEEMKSVLLGDGEDNKNVVWDDIAKCWRFYAVYAD